MSRSDPAPPADDVQRPAPAVPARVAALLALWTCIGAAAPAEHAPEAPPIDTHVRVEPDAAISVITAPRAGVIPSLPAPPATPAPATADSGGRAAVKMFELPPDFAPVGGRSRPHHAIGLRSVPMESWLQERGFAAHRCYLPMLRLHTKLSSASDGQATLWIYARCSFR